MTVTKANSTEQKNGFSIFPISEEKKLKRYLYVTLEPRSRKLEGITALPRTGSFWMLYGAVNIDPDIGGTKRSAGVC